MINKLIQHATEVVGVGDKTPISLKEIVLTGIVLDFLLLAIASTVLDNGTVFVFTSCTAFGHWFGIAYIVIRRRKALTRVDAYFVRFGMLGLVFFSFIISYVLFAI